MYSPVNCDHFFKYYTPEVLILEHYIILRLYGTLLRRDVIPIEKTIKSSENSKPVKVF